MTLRFHAQVAVATLAMVCALSGAAAAQTQGLFNRKAVLRESPTFPRATELAGNALTSYPHFEYVSAFNEGATIAFALDPTRFPASAGNTVDLYIVEARDKAEWLANPGLVDVRGMPQTETLGAATIQSSTFALTGSGSLSGDAGTGLGVGYDLVCDVDRDGQLDGGDFIDGRGDVAGFYVVHDVTQPGPLTVTETAYSVATGSVTPGFENENLFYPTDIASMGSLPLIVVSHGNGHQYVWYDHIGQHLASYGYVVMSHQNNTVPGVQTAATTTLEHTDAFIDQLAEIAGGLLEGHVDTTRIVWIGHSRGAEGVAIAYDRIRDGAWAPLNYQIQDIALVSSIAPVDFQGPSETNPHGVPFSLWTGGADGDVDGCADSDVGQTFHLHDRAEQWRQSISLHGVGHGDFHNGGGSSVAAGPCLVGRADTHQIMRGYLLPLVKHYVDNNVPARDFLWRQWESFQPIGAPTANPCVTVDLMFREDPAATYVVDDFQTQSATDVSSSGAPVSFTVADVTEGLLDDGNATFTDSATDEMNGMTVASAADTSRGIVFSWNADAFYQLDIAPGERDLTDDQYLAFRACQATRHPATTTALGDLTFRVTLVDGALGTSSIDIGAYGGGIEEPYQRSGCGNGTGWANEFETIRIRLSDFLTNNSGLDLSDIAAIRFDFGPSHGSAAGRLGLDEITISSDPAQPLAGAISIALESDASVVAPDVSTDLTVRIRASAEDIVPGSALLHYRLAGGPFTTVALLPAGPPERFSATLPAPMCTDAPEFFFSVEGSLSGESTLPADAPTSHFAPIVGNLSTIFADDFESDTGWTAEVLGATSGFWQRGIPVNDDGWDYDPAADADGSGRCYLTQNEVGNTDVDNGAVRLTSPTLDLTGDLVLIDYAYFLKLTVADGVDQILVEYNGNDGIGTWNAVASHASDGGLTWRDHQITSTDIVAAGGTLSATARLRFTANDDGTQSIVEAGIDGFTVRTTQCD